MASGRYGITGISFSKGEIQGFFIVDTFGEQKLISKKKVMELAENGEITNWSVVVDEDGEKHLYSENNSIENLPEYLKDQIDNLEIINKFSTPDGKEGYLCKDNDGNKHYYGSVKLWNLVKAGKVKNARAVKYNGARAIVTDNGILRTSTIASE
jgi:hypothetical protein